MKIKFWGVRGSVTTTGDETAFYGGNTSCVEVLQGDWQLVFDGGSGLKKLNAVHQPVAKRIDILLTHLHMDHIQGLGFFKALFEPGMDVHIWGPVSSSQTLHTRLSRYLSPPLFPILIRDLPCKLTLHEIANSHFTIGQFNIQSEYIIHPGPTVGFRVSAGKSVFTYIPDHEPALGEKGIIPETKWISGYNLAAGADLLLHDAQYTAAEYKAKKGWGHSSINDAALFASMARVKHVLFAHHDPFRTDDQLNEMFAAFKIENKYPFKNELAREGMVINLD